MQFAKMQGTGNDFILIDCLGSEGERIAAQAQENVVFLNDRHFGIGGDGLLLLLPGQSAPYQMKMFNPDGSESEMCGNGIRCFAKYLFDHGLTNGQADLSVETGAGVLRLHCRVGQNGGVEQVRVDMGEPRLLAQEVPTTLGAPQEQVIAQPLLIGDHSFLVTCVSMGNPHAVLFVDDVGSFPIRHWGPLIEKDPHFPKRTNTEFIQIVSRSEIIFRVWERGAGETLACGTGACASVVASALNDRTDRQVLVHLPGGDLEIEWSAQDNRVYMTGPAAEVFTGVI